MDFASRLELLLEVSRHGSFAKAADRLNIDRSVLSKQIKQLEDSLGVRLLNRTTRSVSLTSVGQEIVLQAEKVTDLLNETKQIAETFHSEPQGHIRISSTTMFGRKYLQKAVEVFAVKYPKASIELYLDDHRVDMIGERFDLVFRIGPIRESSMIARKLADNSVALVASEAFIEKHGLPQTPEELVELPSIIYSNGDILMNKLQISSGPDIAEPRSYNMWGQYMVNETELILEAVKAGLGYAQIGHFMLSEDIKSLGLVQLLPEYQLPSYGDIYAMYSHRNQPPLVKAFIDTVQEIVGTPPVWAKNFNI
ncbi:LysR family transcriptional regulator [Vibrio sp. JC009]|uniref:LysR family transcriptional regulator n=1 Tax=Vibrio sp. JC009 TaxID=2912314 RepID=UPI0023AF7E9A|nr:LysR family transcriptional regulator [Vibrio sp. JC009]WED23438.1 LysR family transcriptional regulator [Vibrio sp. JC009]